MTVEDEQIIGAVLWLASAANIVAEPSGATTVAAALAGVGPMDGPVVAIVSGGNMSVDTLEEFRRARSLRCQ